MLLTHHVEDCCGPWEVTAVEERAAFTRRHLRCTRCGRRKFVTVTVLADRTAEDVRDVIPLRDVSVRGIGRVL